MRVEFGRRAGLVGPLVVAGLLLAACNDGSDASSDATADTAVASAAATSAPDTTAAAPEETAADGTAPDSTTSDASAPDGTDANLDPSVGPAGSEADNELEVITPLVANVLAEPRPVLGDDEQIHLAYELFATNAAEATMTVDLVEVLGPDGVAIGELTGDELQGAVQYIANQEAIGPAQQFRVFMDQTFPAGAEVPESISHRFTVTLTPEDGDVSSTTVVSGATTVDTREAILVGAPLRGTKWVVSGGCCFPADYHRTATLPVNGQFYAPERYAIDFVQLNDQDTLYDGPVDALESFAYYGDDILSVADGTVVRIQDGLEEQTPGSFEPGATAASAGGNFVVVDIGDGHFAFYAHMQPGSLTVEEGDEVTKGEVLGLLGNTGNSDGPHLHFHVMDGPGPLSSNGLPYRFESFEVTGTLTNTADIPTGVVAELDETLTGSFTDVMPLDNQLLTFPD